MSDIRITTRQAKISDDAALDRLLAVFPKKSLTKGISRKQISWTFGNETLYLLGSDGNIAILHTITGVTVEEAERIHTDLVIAEDISEKAVHRIAGKVLNATIGKAN